MKSPMHLLVPALKVDLTLLRTLLNMLVRLADLARVVVRAAVRVLLLRAVVRRVRGRLNRRGTPLLPRVAKSFLASSWLMVFSI